MLTQAVAIAWMAVVSGFWLWAIGAAVLGAGTAMVYPTLPAVIGDVAHPNWRARSVGIYRLRRDAGFAVGAILSGLLADLVSIDAAIYAIADLTGTATPCVPIGPDPCTAPRVPRVRTELSNAGRCLLRAVAGRLAGKRSTYG